MALKTSLSGVLIAVRKKSKRKNGKEEKEIGVPPKVFFLHRRLLPSALSAGSS
jgi:hypothetical protein